MVSGEGVARGRRVRKALARLSGARRARRRARRDDRRRSAPEVLDAGGDDVVLQGAGVAAAAAGDVQTHKAWMARNYAMAFGAVTLRIYLGMFTALQIPFEEGYPVVAWLSWVPNLILVEWWMALSSQTRAARKSITATPIDTVSSAV